MPKPFWAGANVMTSETHVFESKAHVVTFREHRGPVNEKCAHCAIEDTCLDLPEISDYCEDVLGGAWRVINVKKRMEGYYVQPYKRNQG